MTKHFATGQRMATNNDAERVEQAFEKLTERVTEAVIPAVVEVIRQEMAKAGNGNKPKDEGDDMAANLAQYAMPSDDDFQTLPDGDSKPGSNGRRMPGPSDGYELPD